MNAGLIFANYGKFNRNIRRLSHTIMKKKYIIVGNAE